jgi:hypothetical protein
MPSRLETNLAAVTIAGSLRSAAFSAPATQELSCRRAATLQFGLGFPKPQPPSRVWAIAGPAHLPVLNAQQPCWQSESTLQGPVTNWSPRRPRVLAGIAETPMETKNSMSIPE